MTEPISLNEIEPRVYKDRRGQRFGRLIALRPAVVGARYRWLCLCDCGRYTMVATSKLVGGHTKSCGCLRTHLDFEGKVFTRLTVLERLDSRTDNHVDWLCVCSCGIKTKATAKALLSGSKRSCGCLSRELSSMRNTTHGNSNSPEYRAWRGMKKRCAMTKASNPRIYASYAGKGITVCDRWQGSFENFLSDMGHMPEPGLTLDRIENDKGYEPNNCRWADYHVQQFNRGAPKSSKTGVTGVHFNARTGKWTASLMFEGKKLLDKIFDSFAGALVAREQAEASLNKLIEFRTYGSQKHGRDNAPDE